MSHIRHVHPHIRYIPLSLNANITITVLPQKDEHVFVNVEDFITPRTLDRFRSETIPFEDTSEFIYVFILHQSTHIVFDYACIVPSVIANQRQMSALYKRISCFEAQAKLKTAIATRNSARRRGWCVAHNKQCPQPVDNVLAGGSSCVDFSNAGSRKG